MSKHALTILFVSFLIIASSFSQGQGVDPIIQTGTAVKLSDHVYGIPDNYVGLVPNIGIVLGDDAVLVIDTGLGPRNGELVLQEVNHLGPKDKLYVVTTHYHPEHTLGFAGLGESAQLIIPKVQQKEMENGEAIKNAFARRSDVTTELLRDVDYPRADILFEDEIVLDLGGLTARVFHLGSLHTRGDTMIYIEEEGVLFTGDVVMQGLFPSLDANNGSIRRWLEVLDILEALNPTVIVGAHGSFGGIAMIDAWRQLFITLQADIRALKEEGIPEADAAEILNSEYADWNSDPRRMNAAVRVAYKELP